jgi:hypothetical protein
MTLTSIGYGDVVPEATIERFAVIWLMFFGGLVWAVVLGNIAGLYGALCKDEFDFGMILDDLNLVLEDNGVEAPLRIRMRSFLHSARQTVRRQSQVRVLDNLSPGLQGEYALSLHTYWIEDTPWLVGTHREFVTAVFRGAELSGHCKGEILGQARHMHYIRLGMAGFEGEILHRNQSWAYEQLVLESPLLLQNSSAMAMTFVELYSLSRERVREACLRYPNDAIAVRKATVRLAFRYGVHYICRTQRAARMLNVLKGGDGALSFLRDGVPFENQSVDEKLRKLMLLVEKQYEKLEAIEVSSRNSVFASPTSRTPPVRAPTVFNM